MYHRANAVVKVFGREQSTALAVVSLSLHLVNAAVCI
jgi:hypothetical protein